MVETNSKKKGLGDFASHYPVHDPLSAAKPWSGFTAVISPNSQQCTPHFPHLHPPVPRLRHEALLPLS